ncbi:SIMPL domain-containing protein [Leifsonia sp. H3M29-4]|uniref:SIMPL domain-containing protein n=1 Tax=Salinibacterium metalliresistens TaxID=3031321 RepID=UPI0023DA6CD0|nr:SIMPL domain-containing protein [Salinibacterium metalliresistens]MDF1479647.1 SIMPL domain-containing protein [Salinibacterium metalliresistens]
MADTTITVQGEYSAWYPAERATVHVSVSTDGPKRDAVFERAVASAAVIRESVEALFDKSAGPVTWWASQSVRVWPERPWNNEGKQLPIVFHAAVDFTVKFKDFEALARWVETVSGIDGAVVGSVSWELTEATRTSATAEVRSRAVKDAVAKATVFANAIGLRGVTAVAIADPGMLGDGSSGGPMPAPAMDRMMAARGFGGGAAPQLELKPDEIAVASVVDARFVAS